MMIYCCLPPVSTSDLYSSSSLLFFLSPPQLEVLQLLSPAQKAELLLRPEVTSLDNGTLSLVFHSLLTGDTRPPPTMRPGGGHNWTSPGYPATYPPRPTYNSYSTQSPHDGLRDVITYKCFMCFTIHLK